MHPLMVLQKNRMLLVSVLKKMNIAFKNDACLSSGWQGQNKSSTSPY